MALRPDEFYDHALAATDDERRLPLARMTGWDISPFEPDGLRVAPLRPPVLPEPARHGEDPSDCGSCRGRDEGIWFDDRWRLTRVTGVGVPLVLMLHPRDHYDLADLPDELAAEQAQLYGSWMVVWDDLLPEYPADVAEADAVIVADALAASYGGRRSATHPALASTELLPPPTGTAVVARKFCRHGCNRPPRPGVIQPSVPDGDGIGVDERCPENE